MFRMDVRSRKKRVRRRDYSSSSSSTDSEMDVDRELKQISQYSKDRPEMVRQMFRALRGEELEAMMPDLLKRCSVQEVQRLCIEELSVMSKKRMRYLVEGREMSSSSGTEESSSEEEKEKEVVTEVPINEVTNSEGEDSLSTGMNSKSPSVEAHDSNDEEEERGGQEEGEGVEEGEEEEGELGEERDEMSEAVEVKQMEGIEENSEEYREQAEETITTEEPEFNIEDKEKIKELFDVEFVEEEEEGEGDERSQGDSDKCDPWDKQLSPSHSKSMHAWAKGDALNPMGEYLQEELDYDDDDPLFDDNRNKKQLQRSDEKEKSDGDSDSDEEMKEVKRRRSARMKHTNERKAPSPTKYSMEDESQEKTVSDETDIDRVESSRETETDQNCESGEVLVEHVEDEGGTENADKLGPENDEEDVGVEKTEQPAENIEETKEDSDSGENSDGNSNPGESGEDEDKDDSGDEEDDTQPTGDTVVSEWPPSKSLAEKRAASIKKASRMIIKDKDILAETQAALRDDLRDIAIDKAVTMMVAAPEDCARQEGAESPVFGPEPCPAGFEPSNDVEDGEISDGEGGAVTDALLLVPPPPPPPDDQQNEKQIDEEEQEEIQEEKEGDTGNEGGDGKSVDLDNTPSWPDEVEFTKDKEGEPNSEDEIVEADLRPEDDALFAEMAANKCDTPPARRKTPPPAARPPPGISGRDGSMSPYGYDYEGYNSDIEEGEMIDDDCGPPGLGPDKPMPAVVKALIDAGKGKGGMKGVSNSPALDNARGTKVVKSSIVPIKTLYNQLKAQREKAKKPKVYTAEPRTHGEKVEEEEKPKEKQPENTDRVNRPMTPPPLNDWELEQQQKEAEEKAEKTEKVKKKKHKSVELTTDFLTRLEKQQRKHEENIQKKLEMLEELKKKRVEKSLAEKEEREKLVSAKMARRAAQTIDISDEEMPGPSTSRPKVPVQPPRPTKKKKKREKFVKQSKPISRPRDMSDSSDGSEYEERYRKAYAVKTVKKPIRPIKQEYFSSDTSEDTDERFARTMVADRDEAYGVSNYAHGAQRKYYDQRPYADDGAKVYKMKDAFGLASGRERRESRQPPQPPIQKFKSSERYHPPPQRQPRYTPRYEVDDRMSRYKYDRPEYSRSRSPDKYSRYDQDRQYNRSRSPAKYSRYDQDRQYNRSRTPVRRSRPVFIKRERRSSSSSVSPVSPPTPPPSKRKERVKFKAEPEKEKRKPQAEAKDEEEPKFELWELEMRARAIKALMHRNNEDPEPEIEEIL